MNNSELIDKAQGIAANLSYNGEVEGEAKSIMLELCHRLGDRTVNIAKAGNGYMMTSLFGRSRHLTWQEALFWRFFERPPAGYFVDTKPEKRYE